MNFKSVTLNESPRSFTGNPDVAENVGKYLSSQFVLASMDNTVGEVLKKVRESGLPGSAGNTVFVVDADGRYQGYVYVSALLREDEHCVLAGLLAGKDIAISEDESCKTAAWKLQRLAVSMLPVTDNRGRLMGGLCFTEALRILSRSSQQELSSKTGIGKLHAKDTVRSELLTSGPLRYPVGIRLAFLMVALAGGLIVGGVVEAFEGTLSAVFALAMFMPLVMDMGGNVGTQSTTIFARGLALGHIKLDRFWRMHMIREALVGVCMAVVIALIGGSVAYVWQGAPNDLPLLGLVVGGALFISVLTAAILGFLLPYVMIRLGFDHAPGADPFITTIKDFTGLATYFLLATLLLGISL